MIESLEDKRFSLKVAGEDLNFLTGIIRAIPNENINQYRLETDNEIYSSKEYYFQVIQEDLDLFNIVIGDTFDYLVGSRFFTFHIESISQDINGWIKLTCTLVKII